VILRARLLENLGKYYLWPICPKSISKFKNFVVLFLVRCSK